MSDVSVWASMQPSKPFNPAAQNPNLGPDAARPLGAPERLTEIAGRYTKPVAPGIGAEDGQGTQKQELPDQITDLYAARFSATAKTPSAPKPAIGVESAVVAKLSESLSQSSEASSTRQTENKALEAALASDRAEAAFDGANNKMAQDRELFKALAKDRSQIRLADNDASPRIEANSELSKRREAIKAERVEAQSTSMVLAAEAGGNGDRFNPTLDLTY